MYEIPNNNTIHNHYPLVQITLLTEYIKSNTVIIILLSTYILLISNIITYINTYVLSIY